VVDGRGVGESAKRRLAVPDGRRGRPRRTLPGIGDGGVRSRSGRENPTPRFEGPGSAFPEHCGSPRHAPRPYPPQPQPPPLSKIKRRVNMQCSPYEPTCQYRYHGLARAENQYRTMPPARSPRFCGALAGLDAAQEGSRTHESEAYESFHCRVLRRPRSYRFLLSGQLRSAMDRVVGRARDPRTRHGPAVVWSRPLPRSGAPRHDWRPA
jgi:hypothetical protein